MKKIAVSGANGFLGAALLHRLVTDGRPVHAFVRNMDTIDHKPVEDNVTSLLEPANWRSALQQCSCFIHCAARAHVTRGAGEDALSEFRKVNVELTLELARQAALTGVKRFIFVSSIGVHGGKSGDKPFTSEGAINPHTPYALSKYEAEQGLYTISRQTGLEVVVVRPPLVYGPNAPGNFGALMRGVQKGWPMPFGAVTKNRRSFVALDNLVDLLVTCIDHQAACNQTFLVSDGEDLSTAELLCRVADAMGRPVRLVPVAITLLRAGALMMGRTDLAQSLLDNLQVDISNTREILGWSPPLSVDEGLRRAANPNT